MRSRLAALFLILTASLHADPLAGAREAFPTQANADAWNLYAYGDGFIAPPPWVGPETDPNPYAYSFFVGGDGVWFFADGFTAGGAFVGDYATQKISGVDVSVNVDPAEIDFIDVAVYANGPEGSGYYFSQIYVSEDLGELPDWYLLNFSFKENWYSLQGGNYVAFRPNQGFLASIEEVGLRVFPVAGVSSESYVGMDDFILVPTVEGPALTTSVSGGDFVLQFTPNPGVSATIQKLSATFQWQPVSGQSGLTGTQIFRTPVNPGSGLFRVEAREKLTPVTSP